jgi:hypothetical protein
VLPYAPGVEAYCCVRDASVDGVSAVDGDARLDAVGCATVRTELAAAPAAAAAVPAAGAVAPPAAAFDGRSHGFGGERICCVFFCCGAQKLKWSFLYCIIN